VLSANSGVLACPAEKTDADFAFLQQQQQSFGILKSLHPQKQFFFSGNKMYIRKKAPHPHAQQIFMATVVLKNILFLLQWMHFGTDHN
jgi:hypothetical protein